MEIETGQLAFRSIYPQTTGFVFNPIAKSFSDWFEIGVSGSGETFSFIGKSGKLFDSNNKFCYYYKNNPLDIELVFRQNTYNYRINDIIFGAGDYSGYYWDAIYVKNFSTTDVVDVDFFVDGNVPNISYSYVYTSDRINYSGWIINESPYTTKLFDATHKNFSTGILFSELPTEISGISSGMYAFELESGYLISGNYIDTKFYYDFGNEDVMLVTLQEDMTPASGYISLAFSDSILTQRTGDGSIDYYWNKSSNLTISLEYSSGYGNIYQLMTGSGNGSGYYSGTVLGSGYVYSNDLTGYIYYSYGNYSGNISATGYGSVYSYATGIAEYDYMVSAVGYESGILSTGVIFGQLDGSVLDGSGYYDFYQSVTGTPSYSIYYGGVHLNPTGTYTGSVAQRYILEAYIFKSGSGSMTSATGLGQVYEKTLSNTWALQAGSYSNVFNDFATSGWTSGSYFYTRTFSGFSNTTQLIDIKISYTGFTGTYDEAILTVSNGYISNQVLISGFYE